MYYAQRGEVLIVMLGGGDKSTQTADIAKALALAKTIKEDSAMTRKIDPAELAEFDLAEQLDGEEAISESLNQVIAANAMAELAHALGVAARARGMTEVARASGITREALYKALRPNASPRFETVSKVCAALGVRLVAQPIHS